MSGHSKWSTIKRAKAITDTRRSAAFTKLAKAITVAARHGGPDPDMNFRLRLAIQKAREGNMPNDNVDRAIKKGAGTGDGVTLQECVYEGFGPDGVGIVVEALTDNRNRTTAEIRNILTKHGGSLAAANSVLWQFEHKGVIRVASTTLANKNADELELALIDAGAEDFKIETEGWTIITPKEALQKVGEYLHTQNIASDSQGLEYVPKNLAATTHAAQLHTCLEELENHDDVNNVFTNADF